MAMSEEVCGPKPSIIFRTHQLGFSWITGIARMPSAIEGASSSHAASVMKPVSVIAIVEPGAAPCLCRNASSKPALRCLPDEVVRGRG